ncbi:MAG: GIY-YIG nuclease family protein [Candidatus Odinarchaeia archaeon]
MIDKDYTYIYALMDSISGEVRYVGKADQPQRRLRYKHLSKSELSVDTPKSSWIKSLLANKKFPKLKILEKVRKEAWQEREVYWIAHYKNLGADLTNSTDGGEGRIANSLT